MADRTTGRCAWCSCHWPLRPGGRLADHWVFDREAGRPARCPGSGLPRWRPVAVVRVREGLLLWLSWKTPTTPARRAATWTLWYRLPASRRTVGR